LHAGPEEDLLGLGI